MYLLNLKSAIFIIVNINIIARKTTNYLLSQRFFTHYTYKNARSFKNVMNYKHDGYHLVSVIVLLQSYSIVFICQLLA